MAGIAAGLLWAAAVATAAETTAATAAETAGAAASHSSLNPVYAKLTSESEPLRLRPAKFGDSQSADEQLAELAKAGGDRYSPDALLRATAVAPHVLAMDREPLEQSDATLQRVRIVFTLRGDLDSLARDSFLDTMLAVGGEESAVDDGAGDDGGGGKSGGEGEVDEAASRPLTTGELRAAGVDTESLADAESYRLIRGELFSRVRFSGVAHSRWSRTDRSILMAVRFDDSFAGQPGLKPSWERLERDDAGELSVVETGPFAGGGAFIKITRWRDDPAMLVVEAELMLVEPKAWFGGSNLIGSKLPPAIQSQVRTIRRAARK
jgi:hypothetical protein